MGKPVINVTVSMNTGAMLSAEMYTDEYYELKEGLMKDTSEDGRSLREVVDTMNRVHLVDSSKVDFVYCGDIESIQTLGGFEYGD